MSLTGALSAATSGLRAQGAQLGAIGENIANATTVAYKTREVDFRSLVTGGSTRSGLSSGGVLFSTRQSLTSQGLVEATDSSTDLAINGKGFFVVSDDPNALPTAYNYSRNGTFRPDADGLLRNSEGYYLMGQRTDDLGNVLALNPYDISSVEPVNVGAVAGTAVATANASFDVNVPADAVVGDSFINSIQINDSLGVAHIINTTWTKTAVDEWTLTYDDPINATTGLVSGNLETAAPLPGPPPVIQRDIVVTFNGDGSLQGTVPVVPQWSITNWTSGASDQVVAVDLGTAGETDGLTHFAANTLTPDLEIFFIDQDGIQFGPLAGVDVDGNGIVTAFFENGVRIPIYQVPIATFPNPNGLIQVNGSIYDENVNAGALNLRNPTEGQAGELISSAIELSLTDTSREFNKMIVSQQAYSSAAQVVSTADEMFDELIAAVR
ncbi:MAG: flagellar hook protein FlgE [Micavibrio sp.]|nr:flagellar hook protein FlgE [Micavibrio sp.]|tara:strand:- start:114417 stop:115733 length:1317 start_codon:yes stop_codon:yes gene_type:complete